MVSVITAAGFIVLIIIAIIAVHILFLPVKIAGRLRSSMSDLFLLKIRWGILWASVRISAGGFATLYLYSFRLKEFSLEEEEISRADEEEEGEGEKEAGRFDTGNIVPLIDQASIILRQIGFDYLRVNARVGLGDPCDTGLVYGLASALEGILSGSDRFVLNVLPVFGTEALELDMEAGFRIRKPYMLIVCIIRIFRITKSDKKDKDLKSTGGAAAA